MHQTLTTTPVRIKSSDNNMHVGKSLRYLCTQSKQAFCIGSWHQDVMAKRTLWGFGRSMEESLSQLKVIIRQEEVL